MKGTILGRIVRDIALEAYRDEEPLGSRVNWAIYHAIPDDMRSWFYEEFNNPPLSQKQGLRLVSWLFKEPRKAIVDLSKIKLLRQARREQFIDIVKDNLPTPTLMVNLTDNAPGVYTATSELHKDLIEYLSNSLKADKDRVTVALQWAIRSHKLRGNDLNWFRRFIKQNSEYEQLLLRELPEASKEPSEGEKPSE